MYQIYYWYLLRNKYVITTKENVAYILVFMSQTIVSQKAPARTSCMVLTFEFRALCRCSRMRPIINEWTRQKHEFGRRADSCPSRHWTRGAVTRQRTQQNQTKRKQIETNDTKNKKRKKYIYILNNTRRELRTATKHVRISLLIAWRDNECAGCWWVQIRKVSRVKKHALLQEWTWFFSSFSAG